MEKHKTRGCSCGGIQNKLVSQADAVMAICVLAMASDGRLHKKELERLDHMINISPLFTKVWHAREYAACIAKAISNRGHGDVLAEVAGLLKGRLAETAYAWAASMIMADGKVAAPEHKLLSELRKALGIHGVLAGKINAVAAILNRSK